MVILGHCALKVNDLDNDLVKTKKLVWTNTRMTPLNSTNFYHAVPCRTHQFWAIFEPHYLSPHLSELIFRNY